MDLELDLPEGAVVVRELRIVQYLDPEDNKLALGLSTEAGHDGDVDIFTLVGMLHLASNALMHMDTD